LRYQDIDCDPDTAQQKPKEKNKKKASVLPLKASFGSRCEMRSFLISCHVSVINKKPRLLWQTKGVSFMAKTA
jgi:hypothetical protein